VHFQITPGLKDNLSDFGHLASGLSLVILTDPGGGLCVDRSAPMLMRNALEANGVRFINGKKPGVRLGL
jgi:hypothetical protein